MNPFPPLRGLWQALLFLLGLVLALVLFDAWRLHLYVPGGEPYWESKSPDGRFTVSVYYNPGIFFPLPPGLQPRGEMGTVVLRENKAGKVLQRVRTEYVDYGTPGVTWDPNVKWVSVVSIGSWDLPAEEPGSLRNSINLPASRLSR
jgi:hypothetical protein